MESADFTKFEQESEVAKKHSDAVISMFEEWLLAKGLGDKTVKGHVQNITFFAHNYLNRYEITPIEDSIMEVPLFFEDYFIPKCMWSSKSSIKENISSFNKFYGYLVEIEAVLLKDARILKQILKEDQASWFRMVR